MTGEDGHHPERTLVMLVDDGTEPGAPAPEELYLWRVELPLDGNPNLKFVAENVTATDSDRAAAIAAPHLEELVKRGHYVSSFKVTRMTNEPWDRGDEVWFRMHVPPVVDGYRVLEVAHFLPGSQTSDAAALVVTTQPGDLYSTHVLVYQDDRRWVLKDGTYDIPTRVDAERELVQRASLWQLPKGGDGA